MAGRAGQIPEGDHEQSDEGPGYWAEKFDLIKSEYGWIPDETILEMKYFRFCQTIDAIYKRNNNERKHYAMVQEIATRFIATIIASTTPLTDKGVMELSNRIGKFSILPGKPEKPKKKELPVGGYEQAMAFFSGMGE